MLEAVGLMKDFRIRDPFVLVDDGKYFMYASGCNEFGGYCDNFIVYKSTDLIDWTEPNVVFKATDDFWSHQDYWAPEVHKYKGKYYMFASLKGENGMRGTQVFVSSTPDGEFKPVSNKAITPAEWMSLDGTFYTDKNGKAYIVFCHEWTQIKNGEICYMELSDDLSKAVSEPKVMFKGSDAKWAKAIDPEGEKFITDGPFLYRGNLGKLFMIWSSNSPTGYTEGIAVSTNDEIDGDWVHLDTPLFEKNGGHGMIFETLDSKLMFTMHRPNSPYGSERAVFMELIDDGDTIRIKQT